MRTNGGTFMTLLVVCSLFQNQSFASRVLPINLEEMVQRADRAFHGRCVDVRVGTDKDLGQTVTWVTFVPQRAVKGQVRGRLTIKMLGNQSMTARPGESTDGLPRFEEGEDVVLLLYKDSPAGLTSPVGFGQGKFKVVRDKSGRPVAANEFGNGRLFDGLSSKARAKLGSRVERWRGTHAVPPDDLLDMMDSLK